MMPGAEEEMTWRRPLCDTYRTPQSLEIFADVPGARRQDLVISVEGDELLLETQPPEGDDRIPRYRRRFHLDPTIDRNAIRAYLQDGVLRLSLSLLSGAGRRTVPIEEP